MTNSTLFYVVRQGDTLSEVATRNGTSVEALCRINAIQNPDLIQAGQVIALTSRAVCKVRILLLDWDRNPIPGATMQLKYCGKLKTVKSRSNGLVPEIVTATPEDIVEISIRRYNGTWEKIAAVPSGCGNKLVTLRSPKLRISAETKPHPKDGSGLPMPERVPPQSAPITRPTIPKSTKAEGKIQANFGDGKGPKAKEAFNGNGLPVTKVTNDQEGLSFISGYTGERITSEDYEAAARKIKVEVAVILAIERQESRGHAYDRFNRPVILYERHHFSKHTNRRYDSTNPDISSKVAYVYEKKNKLGGIIPDSERYCGQGSQYPRLAKAYKLNQEAALKSCSWGKYQILGSNFDICGFKSVNDFVAMMCESEKRQLKAVVKYIEATCLEAARKKDWKAIARAYNGNNYWRNGYDKQLEQNYKDITTKGGQV